MSVEEVDEALERLNERKADQQVELQEAPGDEPLEARARLED